MGVQEEKCRGAERNCLLVVAIQIPRDQLNSLKKGPTQNLMAIASCTILLHPIPAEKTKLSLKKFSKICVPDFFFWNEILYYGFFYPE